MLNIYIEGVTEAIDEIERQLLEINNSESNREKIKQAKREILNDLSKFRDGSFANAEHYAYKNLTSAFARPRKWNFFKAQ
ncbi:TPA: hypothetical protein QDB08_003939 [Burkholderia vietnamiensis]|uniref:hypothetical protein n=1 Tax=Burkholderia vietnamiensis TaxID=60552 RepID=UPI0015947D83|nr:hypothetical protein [Burkholderia vietnamiensis]HDR9010946.1 hypothetical protein [Burkholderia vietnamiensis]HDR9017158.1 hypothetical protein [Burkholderia vietnamiensis]